MTGPARVATVLLRYASRVLAMLSAMAILVIMLLTVADVTQRWATGRSMAGVLEFNEILMVAVVYLGLAYTQRRDEHVSVDLLVTRLPRRARRWVEAVALLLAIMVVGLLLWATLETGLESYARREFRFGLRAVPIWPARLVIPLGLLFLSLEILRSLANRMLDRVPDEVAPAGVNVEGQPWRV